MILFVVLALCAPTHGSELPITVVNPSFESGSTGWSGITTGSSEFYSPVDGTRYATSSGGAGYTTQLTGHTIESIYYFFMNHKTAAQSGAQGYHDKIF